MRWLKAFIGLGMFGFGGYMSYFMFLQNRQALTYMGVMLFIALGGLLLFGAVLKDDRKNKLAGVLGLAAAAALIFALYSIWPMAVVNYDMLGKGAVLVVIQLVGLGLMYYSVRNGKKK